jgi:hypothetical protein
MPAHGARTRPRCAAAARRASGPTAPSCRACACADQRGAGKHYRASAHTPRVGRQRHRVQPPPRTRHTSQPNCTATASLGDPITRRARRTAPSRHVLGNRAVALAPGGAPGNAADRGSGLRSLLPPRLHAGDHRGAPAAHGSAHATRARACGDPPARMQHPRHESCRPTPPVRMQDARDAKARARALGPERHAVLHRPAGRLAPEAKALRVWGARHKSASSERDVRARHQSA